MGISEMQRENTSNLTFIDNADFIQTTFVCKIIMVKSLCNVYLLTVHSPVNTSVAGPVM